MRNSRVPTVALRRLANRMRELREAAGLSQDQVTERTGINRATIYRIEAATVRPQHRTLVTLLRAYGVPTARQAPILVLLAGCDQPTRYDDDLPGEYSEYIGLEAQARAVSNFECAFIPGLLQTEDYARAMIQGVWPSATVTDVDRLVEVRMERQALLHRDDPLTFTAVVDEAALRRHVGGPRVMAAQLHHLLTMAAPNLSLHVIPFTTGAHPGMPGSFALLTFPDAEGPEIVYIDSMATAQFLDGETAIHPYATDFDTLRAMALSPGDSMALIADAIQEMTA